MHITLNSALALTKTLHATAGQGSRLSDGTLPFGYITTKENADNLQIGLNQSAYEFLSSIQSAKSLKHILNNAPSDALSDFFANDILHLKNKNTIKSGHEAFSECLKILAKNRKLRDLEFCALKAALMHKQRSQQDIFRILYRYNHRPLTPLNKARFIKAKKLWTYLQLPEVTNDIHSGHLPLIYIDTKDDFASHWHSWENRNHKGRGRKTYKLYIAVPFEHIRDKTRPILHALAGANCKSCKMGKHLENVLRPDWFIGYFSSLKSLKNASRSISDIIGDEPANPVTFTRFLTRSGSLSWGIDPEYDPNAGAISWRVQVCDILSKALANSKHDYWEAINDALKAAEDNNINTSTWSFEKGKV